MLSLYYISKQIKIFIMTQIILNLATSFANGPVITENNFHLVNRVNFEKWLIQNFDKMSDNTAKEAKAFLNRTEVKSETDEYRQKRIIANSQRAFL